MRQCNVTLIELFRVQQINLQNSNELPKIEDRIGSPLSPYAVTKSSIEQFANVFGHTYGLDWVGLRYFNVFGPKQSPNNPYAAVIPIFAKALLRILS